MTKSLPHGWTLCRVEDIFATFGGGTPSRSNPSFWNGTIPWFSSGDIKSHVANEATETITERGLTESSARLCRPGSVLVVVRSGILKHTLPVAILVRRAAINQDIKCFDSGDDVLNRWLVLAWRAAERALLSENREGTTVQSVKSQTLQNFALAIPPINEQRRILVKLEKLLDRVDLCQRRLAKIPVLLKRFRQTVVAAACSGRLTEDWREKNSALAAENAFSPDGSSEVPVSWTWKLLSEVAQVRGGVTKGRKLGGKKSIFLPYLRVANVQDGFLDLSEIKHIEVLPEDEGKYRLESGDILFTEGGDRDKLGRGTVWRGEIPKCIHQNHIFRARLLSKDVSPDYISIASKSDFSRRYFFENASQTVNLASINLTTLSALPLPLPPFPEQQEILRRIDELFALADQIEARYAKAKQYVDSLKQSILAEAFRGELVPQDPSDEPATVLLERIREARITRATSRSQQKRRKRLTSSDGPLHALGHSKAKRGSQEVSPAVRRNEATGTNRSARRGCLKY
jgi:type I restriction enzyme S subunit